MRLPPAVALLLAAGCARPAPVAAPAAPPPATPAPGPAPVTCADAGVLLRGNVDDQKQAGPAKEAAIARTCRFEQWGPEVLRCVGEQPAAKPCLEKLTPPQRGAYDKALTAWNEAFPDESLDEGLEGFEEGGLDSYIDCGDAIQDASGFSPAVKLTGDDRDYVLALRKDALLALCEGWDYEMRSCFHDLVVTGTAGNSAAVDACRAMLDAAQAKEVTDKLAELDQLGGKVAALKKNPASFDCRKVVAAHYADARWKDRMGAVKGAERARAIGESRARMTKACTDEKWAPTVRACIVAGGGDTCFPGTSSSDWEFPAAGVIVKSGLPECDAYAAAVKTADACAALSQAQRDRYKRSLNYSAQSWASVTTPDRKADAARMCKLNEESLRRTAVGAGCKL
jgi:hypothetical protein